MGGLAGGRGDFNMTFSTNKLTGSIWSADYYSCLSDEGAGTQGASCIVSTFRYWAHTPKVGPGWKAPVLGMQRWPRPGSGLPNGACGQTMDTQTCTHGSHGAFIQVGSMMVKNVGYGPRLLSVKSGFYHSLAVWPWASQLNSQCLSTLIYNKSVYLIALLGGRHKLMQAKGSEQYLVYNKCSRNISCFYCVTS